MAKLISAHRDYGPKLKLNNTVHLDQLAAWMSMRTNVNKGTVMMIQEMNEAILYFNSQLIRAKPKNFNIGSVGRLI